MNIGLAANSAWYLWNFRADLIKVFIKEGYQVTCVSPTDSYTEKLRGLGVKCCGLSLSPTSTHIFKESRAIAELFGVLRKEKLDILLTFTSKINIYGGLCARALKLPQVANISGLGDLYASPFWLLRAFRKTLMKVSLGKAQWRLYQNNEDQVSVEKILDAQWPLNSMRLPGSGVNLQRFKKAIRDRAQLDECVVFLMLGRFLPSKGFDLYVNAARTVKEQGISRSEFWVMGSIDSDRKESIALFQRIEKASSEGIVQLLPWSDSVEQVLSKCDVVVAPTGYNEGVPKSLLEGMASGKVLITTDWKGARDTVDNNKNGILIKKDDPRSLVSSITRIVKSNSETIINMGEESRRKAEEEFDQTIIINRYREIVGTVGKS